MLAIGSCVPGDRTMERICFVVMGFGKKTDYSGTPRTLDLDASYEAIIKPAVVKAGLKCIRADEVSHSGLIDVKMFELLLGADVVVADISTANPNALYELGVRHALKPFTTILMKEVDGKFHFDLNHLATLQYKHLGEDIGAKEAAAKSAQLEALIRSVLAKAEPDSPVYTYLAGLKAPTLGAARAAEAAPAQAVPAESYAVEVEAGKEAALRSDHAAAWPHFARARALQPGAVNPFVTQQLALHRYKSKQPDTVTALAEARETFKRTRVDALSLSTAESYEKPLSAFFKARERRR